MEGVKDENALQNAQFDFRNGATDSSPFDYLPTATMGDNGCGSILKGGKIIIETGKCKLSNFYTFITGFAYSDINKAAGAFAGADAITHMRSIIVGSSTADPFAAAE